MFEQSGIFFVSLNLYLMKVFKVLLIGVLVLAGCAKGEVSDGEVSNSLGREVGKPLFVQEMESGERIEMGFVDNYSKMKLSDVLSECGEIIGEKAELYDFGFVGDLSDVPVVSVEVSEEKELVFKWYKVGVEFSEDDGLTGKERIVVSGENELMLENIVAAKKCSNGKFYVADYLEGDNLWGAFFVDIYDGEELVSKVNFALAQ